MNGITFPTRNKAGEQIEPIEVRKQVQPKNTAPVKSPEPMVALKDDSVSQTTLPGVSQGQSAITEPKSVKKPTLEPKAVNIGRGERKGLDGITPSTRNKAGEQIEITEAPKQVQPKNAAPVKSSEPMVPAKTYTTTYTVNITPPPGAPRGPSAITEPKSGEKPTKEPTAGNTSGGERNNLPSTVEPAKTIIKRSEAGMNTGSGTEGNQASSEPPAATEDSGETDQGKTQKDKSGLGDLADLFATSASEFTEKSRLAEQVNEVDVNELLQEGLGLLGKVKKSDG